MMVSGPKGVYLLAKDDSIVKQCMPLMLLWGEYKTEQEEVQARKAAGAKLMPWQMADDTCAAIFFHDEQKFNLPYLQEVRSLKDLSSKQFLLRGEPVILS